MASNKNWPKMAIQNYRVIDGGIWLPREEIERMIEESYRCALEYHQMKGTEFNAAMLKAEGSANTFEYMLSLLTDGGDSRNPQT